MSFYKWDFFEENNYMNSLDILQVLCFNILFLITHPSIRLDSALAVSKTGPPILRI